jgi:hypothetical protein
MEISHPTELKIRCSGVKIPLFDAVMEFAHKLLILSRDTPPAVTSDGQFSIFVVSGVSAGAAGRGGY